MHDTFLFQKICQSVIRLARDSRLQDISRLELRVHSDSHITEETLLKHLRDQVPQLLAADFSVVVERTLDQSLTAVITRLEGTMCE